jgi:hypothetical protein
MSRRRRTACVLMTALVGAGSFAAGAGATSPSAYRARVNALCRTYTPKLQQVEADALAAKRANNVHRLFYDLGYAVALALREDHAIEAIPVPAALQAQMGPILRVFRRVDGHATRFIADAQANDLNGALAELKPIDSLSAPTNRMLDRAGLPDCGSRQG